ncbi:MAG: hypothetical protein RL619_656 [Bacteroidota bacterium]|jgi:hypothetical protein
MPTEGSFAMKMPKTVLFQYGTNIKRTFRNFLKVLFYKKRDFLETIINS